MTDSAPATLTDQAQRLETVNRQIAEWLRRPAVAARLRAAGPDEWSALEIVGHMAEMIAYWTGNAQMLVAASGEPPHFGRTLDAPDRLAGPRRGATADPEALLSQLDTAIQAAVAEMRALTPAQAAKTGIHNRRGEMPVSEIFADLIVSHAEEHETQVKRVLGLAA